MNQTKKLLLYLTLMIPIHSSAGSISHGSLNLTPLNENLPSSALEPSDSLQPSPKLQPHEVVKIQVEALRENGVLNRGIEITYRFASPDNRKSTGPLARFTLMIKQGPYSTMLNHLRADYDPVISKADVAIQRVTILGADKKLVSYIFMLSRQQASPCKGCWMTDAVFLDRQNEEFI